MVNIWARFDTESNAVDNLEKALYFLGKVKSSPEDWKWVIICCQSALYGFSVHVAKGTDDESVTNITKNGSKRLITFDKALKICRNIEGAREALITTSDEDESLKVIQKEYRNKFEHFNPGSWSIEVSGFPHHIKNVINVTRRVAVDINFYTHIYGEKQHRLLTLIDECLAIVNELKQKYE